MKTLLATIEKRVQVPVLHTIAQDKGVFVATDMDIETRLKTDLTGIKTGLYNFKPLKEGIYSVADMPMNDFPTFGYKESVGTIKGVKLNDIEFVSIAMSTEQTRYYLNGIAFDSDNMIATDGHRLHIISHLTPALKDKSALIIPSKAVKLFIMACKESKVTSFDIELLGESYVRAVIGDYTITSKLIDGTFPDYRRVIPASHEYKLEFKADSIVKNYKKLCAVSSGKSRAVKLSGDKVTAKSELGTFECESGVVMPKYSDSEGVVYSKEIGFNLNYLKESTFDSVMHFQDNTSPVMFKAGNRGAVLMPLRI
jgi:DNA polymerase-3 subunit beta